MQNFLRMVENNSVAIMVGDITRKQKPDRPPSNAMGARRNIKGTRRPDYDDGVEVAICAGVDVAGGDQNPE